MAPPPSWQRHAAAVVSGVSLLILVVVVPPSTTAIGVNYGTKGDNLPPPATVASFLANRTRIDRVKLFDRSPDMVRAFAGTGIALLVTAGNGDIPKLATKDGAAAWVAANVAPYYPSTDISLVAVGNEIMDTGDAALISNLVPAMRALRSALVAAGYRRIRVSTPHSLGILAPGASAWAPPPPSASRFRDGWDRAVFAPMLAFHRQTRSPFMVNAYPYFGYNGDTLPYALARPGGAVAGNPGVPDPGTGITYTSMFEAQLDAVYSAMKKLGFDDVEIAVGETGWPTKAEVGQIGVGNAEAAEYNRYLIGEAAGGSGTPLMPGRTFETYIFALFNENLKPGPVAERNFGLFYANLTPVYDVGLMKTGAAPAPAAATVAAAPESSEAAPHGAGKKGDVEVAAAPEETAAASASAPAPSSVEDEGSAEATGLSPSSEKGDSTDEDKPTTEEEGGDAPAPAAAAASGPADESSETAAKDGGDAADGGKTPAPAGAASHGTNLRVPVSFVLIALSSLAIGI